MRSSLLPSLALVLSSVACAFADPTITTQRVPDNGIEPQVAVDSTNTLHLIYFKGDPAHGNVFYTRSTDSGKTFQPPTRVNSDADSALIIGSVRGPQLALGRDNRPHVIWTSPRGSLFYSRLKDKSFEPQREIIKGLDGGASIAADNAANVYIVFHALTPTDPQDEQHRRIFIARSRDDGQTFAGPITSKEVPPLGACACCSVHAFFAPDNRLRVIYRCADQTINRDMYLLRFDETLEHATHERLDAWQIGKCVMSTATASGNLMAWESRDRIACGNGFSRPTTFGERTAKHPVLLRSREGTLLVWTEGSGWNKGGSIAWQLLDASNYGMLLGGGHADGLPVWGTPAAFATPQGNFVILY